MRWIAPQFARCARPNENTVYAAEEFNFRVQKLEIQPAR
jgi:hypothetical protein